MSQHDPVRISWKNVAAFRLSRHHLSKRAPITALTSVPADMAGAQSQVLSAGQMSIWARLKEAKIGDLDSALWKHHTLVRTWCMRGTLFLVPSKDLAVFARGTSRRPGYHFRWALSRVGSRQAIDKLLDKVLDILKQPRTRTEIAETLSKSHGYRLKSKAGGGWGNKTAIQWVEVGNASLPIGYLFHIIGSRDVICSGPNKGNETTYVRADKWVPDWKDIPREQAERELLVRYLRAHGPSTVQDFALWMGQYAPDAKEIWSGEAENMAQVDVEGWKANTLQSDLQELEEKEVDGPIVNLLPFFDSYLLGHKSHHNIVDEIDRKKIYRPQGWVSPVLLVDGRAQGVWSHVQKGNELEVRVTPFSKLPARVSSRIREEATGLGRFFECPSVKTIFT